MDERKKGTWALVLGCSVGVGAEVARVLAKQNGLHVIGMHRGNHEAEAAELQAEVRSLGLRCEMVVANAGQLANIPELADEVQRILDGETLKVAVHSLADASVGMTVHHEPQRALHPKQILKTFEVMSHSFLYWGQHLFGRGLLGGDSQIIALLNYLEQHVVPGGAAICASKAALSGYMRYMAAEYARYGIRVNGVRFGPVETWASTRVPNFYTSHANLKRLNPMGRNGTIADTAGVLSLLLEDRAAFINGAVINVDGGEEASILQGTMA